MSKTSDIDAGMRTHFMQKASLPRKQIAQANMFLSHLKEVAKPSDVDVKNGKDILDTLAAKTELYEFYAAVRAGQESGNDSDIEQRVSAIAKSVEPAEKAVESLRKALDTLT